MHFFQKIKFNFYKSLLLTIVVIIQVSCIKKEKNKELPQFNKNGIQIVYSENVYAEMWIKNRNLKVTVIDTFCINQKSRAIRDIEKGKLIYFGFHPREFKRMTEILSKYGIKTKEHLGRCIRMGGFEPYCYEEEMDKEINRRFGGNFIDSILQVARKEFILKNPHVSYFEDGIDLREKYLKK